MNNGSALSSGKIVAFIAARNRDAARVFYRDTLGFPLLGEDQFAMVFDANGTMLRVAAVKDWTPPHFTLLGWEVPDIVATVKALNAAGVHMERFGEFMKQDELGIWISPSGHDVSPVHAGAKVAWFKDPDGNVLSVSQHQ